MRVRLFLLFYGHMFGVGNSMNTYVFVEHACERVDIGTKSTPRLGLRGERRTPFPAQHPFCFVLYILLSREVDTRRTETAGQSRSPSLKRHNSNMRVNDIFVHDDNQPPLRRNINTKKTTETQIITSL